MIIKDYEASLFGYMRANNANDVVVTMPVTIDVTNEGKQKFFVAVAVTTRFEGPEALSDEIERSAPKGHTPCLHGCQPIFIIVKNLVCSLTRRQSEKC